ncbi:hypothetical protein [Glutamicibacter sp. NPDC087344]|uniref:hypothetical protein n=1 Tax=Glutamicibacter sp. NPDC087344 TaxID=3363994 RepID=UPI00380CF2D7
MNYDVLDERPDLGILIERKKFMSGLAAVQVIANDEVDQRLVAINALGDSGFSIAMNGLQNSANFGLSKKLAAEIIDALHSADSDLEEIG